MNRRSFPIGYARAALLKALLRILEGRLGADAGDAWLASLRMVRADVEDETRPVPLSAIRSAMQSFVERCGDAALSEVSRRLLDHDNLGAWGQVLRGSVTPHDVLGRFEASESEFGRTTRWQTVSRSPGSWTGRVDFAHDPQNESDGLLDRARRLELAAVPGLFGYKTIAVTKRSEEAGARIYGVTWGEPSMTRSIALLAGVFGLVSIGTALFSRNALIVAAAVSLGTLLGGVIGWMRFRDAMRRIEASAHAMRVRALERSLHLRETNVRTHATNLEGSVVAGQYRIGRRMGSGASGVIYEALRITDGLPVAIKLLRAVAAQENVASDRLRREAEALGLAWHPNVVEVVDYGSLPDGTAYLVMELLHGESLSSRLERVGKLPLSDVHRFALQVCEALAALHAAGVVHRDIKPSNLIVVPDGQSEKVKVIDFGIARVEWEELRITQTGGPLGTPGYMSPEQELGGPIDGRSDLFALGAVIHECITGEPPPPISLHARMRKASERSVSAIDSGVHRATHPIPTTWRVFLQKAMAEEPGERFTDARSFANALRGLPLVGDDVDVNVQ